MVMSPDFNNYNPFQAWNPGTALQDVRNQMMSAYGTLQNARSNASGTPPMGGEAQMQPVGMPQVQQPMGQTPMPTPGSPFANYGGVQNQWQGQYAIQNNPFMQPQQMMGAPAAPMMGSSIPAAQGSPFTAPSTGGIAGYGLPVGQGAPGGNGVEWLRSMGMPIPTFLDQISQGQSVGPANYNNALRGLGGVQGLMSPQTLANLAPSELQFLQGFFETVLGIPFNDIINAAYQPFAGLGNAQTAGFNWQ